MPTRTVTVMCLIQVLLIVICYLAASANLRTYEKLLDSHGLGILQNTRWYVWMAAVRRFVWLMLLIPVGTAVLCARLTQTYREMALLREGGFGLALLITTVIVVFAFMTAGHAFSGPGPLGSPSIFQG